MRLFLGLFPLYPDEQRLMCLKLDIRENLDYTWNIPERETKVYMLYVAGFILFCKGHSKLSPNNKINVSYLKLIENRGKQKV